MTKNQTEVKTNLEEGVNSLAKEFKRFNDRKRNDSIVSAIVSLGYFTLIGFLLYTSTKESNKTEKPAALITDKDPKEIREEIKEDQEKLESAE